MRPPIPCPIRYTHQHVDYHWCFIWLYHMGLSWLCTNVFVSFNCLLVIFHVFVTCLIARPFPYITSSFWFQFLWSFFFFLL
jgi:hypothetical protein